VAEETETLSVTMEEQRAAVARIRAEVKGNATVTKEMIPVRIAAVRIVHAIIEALMQAGADPLTVNNRRRKRFALANEENASFMSELLLDPTVAQAIEEHRAVEEEIAFQQEEERYRTRRTQISSLRPKPFTAVQKDRQPAGNRPRQTPLEKKDQLLLMTMQSGRLRPRDNLARSAGETKTVRASMRSKNTTASSAKGEIDTRTVKPTEARPWGGSAETEQFQREVHGELKTINDEAHEFLDRIKDEFQKLRDRLLKEDDPIEPPEDIKDE
jgi:hypothetical protein